MKTFLALIVLASLASATSIQRYDRWACYFPTKLDGSMVRSYNVNIEYDLAIGKGTAVMYADCPACRIMPREIPVQRGGHERTLTYVNSKENFNLQIIWTNTTLTSGPYSAVWNQKAGTCYPRR